MPIHMTLLQYFTPFIFLTTYSDLKDLNITGTNTLLSRTRHFYLTLQKHVRIYFTYKNN